MEPITIAIICAAAFGTVVAVSAFVRQLILSRNKSANDNAQRRALGQEANQLSNLRKELEGQKRFESHYQVLGNNSSAIRYIDEKIEEIITQKTALIDRYSELSMKQSHAIIDGKCTHDKKLSCDNLKLEIDKQLKVYDEQLSALQKRRAKLWDANDDLQHYLLEQEAKRNEKLDTLYQKHSEILEKVFVRHDDNSLKVTQQSMTEGTSAFKMMINSPMKFLLGIFGKSTGIDLSQVFKESNQRGRVSDAEDDINQDSDLDDSPESQYDQLYKSRLAASV